MKRPDNRGGQGSGAGKGLCNGRGAGGRNRDQEGAGLGAGGFCVCAKCGYRAPHSSGVPCMQDHCPKCGVAMVREGSDHHQKILKKKAEKEGRAIAD